jgi:hypothetical protein
MLSALCCHRCRGWISDIMDELTCSCEISLLLEFVQLRWEVAWLRSSANSYACSKVMTPGVTDFVVEVNLPLMVVMDSRGTVHYRVSLACT